MNEIAFEVVDAVLVPDDTEPLKLAVATVDKVRISNRETAMVWQVFEVASEACGVSYSPSAKKHATAIRHLVRILRDSPTATPHHFQVVVEHEMLAPWWAHGSTDAEDMKPVHFGVIFSAGAWAGMVARYKRRAKGTMSSWEQRRMDSAAEATRSADPNSIDDILAAAARNRQQQAGAMAA